VERLASLFANANVFRSAMLSVKIKNTGDGAYQQDIYGDSIIVERHFSRSGSSSFKLKSSTGRMMSTRKADLEDICDYYALQIDNPMNVLTQDMARQFLNNSTPTDKYKFFMKGTQLEHLDGDYLIVEQNLEAIDQDLWKKTEDLNIFRERYEKARHLLSLSEMQDTLRQRIKTLMNMMAWAQVEEREKELRMCNNKLARMDEKIEALEMKAAGLNEAFGQIEQSSEHAVQGVEDAKSALTPLQEEKDRIKREHDRFKAEQMALHVCFSPLKSISLLTRALRLNNERSRKKSKQQRTELEKLRRKSQTSTRGSVMLMEALMIYDAQRLRRKGRKLMLPKGGFGNMRMNYLLLRITNVAQKGSSRRHSSLLSISEPTYSKLRIG
jgi:chromosome segregation ATPase